MINRRKSAAVLSRRASPAQCAEELWVASSRGNSVQLVNLATGQVEQSVAGRRGALHGLAARGRTAFTSATGAATRPRKAIRRRMSSGTPVARRPDDRHRQSRQRLGPRPRAGQVEAAEDHSASACIPAA